MAQAKGSSYFGILILGGLLLVGYGIKRNWSAKPPHRAGQHEELASEETAEFPVNRETQNDQGHAAGAIVNSPASETKLDGGAQVPQDSTGTATREPLPRGTAALAENPSFNGARDLPREELKKSFESLERSAQLKVVGYEESKTTFEDFASRMSGLPPDKMREVFEKVSKGTGVLSGVKSAAGTKTVTVEEMRPNCYALETNKTGVLVGVDVAGQVSGVTPILPEGTFSGEIWDCRFNPYIDGGVPHPVTILKAPMGKVGP